MHKLGANIDLSVLCLTGLGAEIVYSLGTCELDCNAIKYYYSQLYLTMFMIEDLDAIIGWDVISQANLQLNKGVDSLKL